MTLSEDPIVNVRAFDRYSFAHATIGFACGSLGMSPLLFLGLSILWEVVEDPLKDRFPYLFPNASHDTMTNAVGDVISNMTGFALAYYTVRK